jgi:hypothetical protein
VPDSVVEPETEPQEPYLFCLTGTGMHYGSGSDIEKQDFVTFFCFLKTAKYCLDPELEPELEP